MEKKYFLVSVIVPIYNVEQYLPKCLDSIINQTYHNIEIILVDDGSQDRCGEICDEYAEKDNRIKVIHKENGGVTEARISGFKASIGEYITFVDSDDYVDSSYVEILYNNAQKYNSQISVCQIVKVYGNRKKIDFRSQLGYFNKNDIYTLLREGSLYDYGQKKPTFFWGLCAKLIKRECLCGAFEVAKGYWMGEDLLSCLYILYHVDTLYISSKALYYYVQHESQSTRRGDLATWNNQIGQWNAIIQLDKDRLLKEQLPYRILLFVKVFIKNNLQTGLSYNEFYDRIIEAMRPPIMIDYFCLYDYKNLTFMDRCFLYFIKNRHYKVIYCVSKIGVKLLFLKNFREWK